MLSLSQKFSLQQKLSPQQIQYQKLLQLNTLALEQRIKTELELNPILEEDLELKETEPLEDAEDIDYNNEQDEFTLEDYMNDEDEYDDYSSQNTEQQYDPVGSYTASKVSVADHLMDQLALLDIDENEHRLGEEIIGNLDEDGYLKRELNEIVEDLQLFDHIEVELEKAEALLKKIQSFDPVGVACRSLQECLLVQLQHSSYDPYYTFLAEQMLRENYEDFVNKRFELLQSKMNLSQETLRSVLDIIHKLNPKPGEGNIDSLELNQITPDFIIEKDRDKFIIQLNDKNMPAVTVNKTYVAMLEANKWKKNLSPQDKGTHKFLREKFESARWFIACIEQRRDTMMKTMQAIVERQYDFFESGAKHLKPMVYKDIADMIGMDISTISRVVNGKFVQSPQGTHELKYFFSEGLSTDSGEEVSNKFIKERIKEIVDNEDKSSPMSDDKIADILNEDGVHIARRTIAKYREQLRIPVARMRKEFRG